MRYEVEVGWQDDELNTHARTVVVDATDELNAAFLAGTVIADQDLDGRDEVLAVRSLNVSAH